MLAHRLQKVTLPIFCGLVICMVSTRARGQEAEQREEELGEAELPGRELTDEDLALEEAREHFEQAVSLYQEGDFEAALAEFRASYDLNPLPQVLFNIAVTLHDLNRVIEAMDTLDVYLEQATEEPGGRRAQAQNLYVMLSGQVARVGIECDEEGAEITVNDDSQGHTPLPEPLRLLAGEYQLELALAGYHPYRQRLDLRGGQELNLAIALEPLPEPWYRRLWWIWPVAGTVVVVGAIVLSAVLVTRPDGAEFNVVVERGGGP